MESIVLSALTGLAVGYASAMFCRSRSIKLRVINIIAALGGGILTGYIAHVLGLALPIPAFALVGALAAIMVVIIFRKPDRKHRSYYL